MKAREKEISPLDSSGVMGSLLPVIYIVLLLLFIATIPLTLLARYAWNDKRLFLLFSAIGIGSMITLFVLIWPEV